MKTNKMKSLQSVVSAFETNVLFNDDSEIDNVQAVFIDHKSKERRAVIIVDESSDMDSTFSVIKKHFRKSPFKIIERKGSPNGTASLQTGKGIRHMNSVKWGTLGGIFNRQNDAFLYGLSNAHVIANVGNAQKGDNCIYDPNIVAGKLFNWINLKSPPAVNKMDAALFRINSRHATIWFPRKPANRLIGPRINLNVYKNGRNTKVTHGVIKAYNGAAEVILNGRKFNFSGIIAIRGANGNFNGPGDSGSIVFSERGHHMVGLVFAKFHEYCYALPISRVGPLFKK
jgi:hypothetical protein